LKEVLAHAPAKMCTCGGDVCKKCKGKPYLLRVVKESDFPLYDICPHYNPVSLMEEAMKNGFVLTPSQALEGVKTLVWILTYRSVPDTQKWIYFTLLRHLLAMGVVPDSALDTSINEIIGVNTLSVFRMIMQLAVLDQRTDYADYEGSPHT